MLWRYALRAVAGPSLAWVAFLCALFYLVAFLRGIDVLLGSAVGPVDLFGVFLLLTPQYLVQVTPVAFLLGTVQGLGRLSDDGEVKAAQALGASPLRLLAAPLVLAIAMSLGLAGLSSSLQPWGVRAVRERVVDLLQRNAARDVAPGQFFQGLAGLTVYAEHVADGQWRNVWIHDARTDGRPTLTMAQSCTPVALPQAQGLGFELKQGATYVADGPHDEVQVNFASGTVRAALGDSGRALSSFRFAREELTLQELFVEAEAQRARGEDNLPTRLVLHERVRQVLVPLALALLAGAVALTRRERKGGSAAIAVTMAVYLTYHFIARSAQSFGEQGRLDPLWASLMPNLIALLVSAMFVVRLYRRGAA